MSGGILSTTRVVFLCVAVKKRKNEGKKREGERIEKATNTQ
jgi:hypothetical protein